MWTNGSTFMAFQLTYIVTKADHLKRKFWTICILYGVKQSTTMPYNLHGNSTCERFNHTLHDLLKTLGKEQKTKLAFALIILGVCL